MPDAMALSMLIPIPKDNNDIQNSDKYRGIALSAVCTKLFEYIILSKYGHMLTSGDLQFAYKANTSTTQCTWVAREVVSITIKLDQMSILVYLTAAKLLIA